MFRDTLVWVSVGWGQVLGGSWVAISGVISRVTIAKTQMRGLTTTTYNYP